MAEPQSLVDDLVDWLNLPRLSEARQFLETHPHLVSGESTEVIAAWVQMAREEGDQHKLRSLEFHQDLLWKTLRGDASFFYDEAELQELLERLNNGGERRTRAANIALMERASVLAHGRLPELWGQLQGSLGNEYAATVSPEEFRRGIDCFKAALEVFDRDSHPDLYAQTQWNIALALTRFAQESSGDEQIDLWVEAMARETEARQLRPGVPRMIMLQRARDSLGSHFFQAGEWTRAAEYLDGALQGFGALYTLLTSRGREWEGEWAAELPAQVAYAHIRMETEGSWSTAVRALENGRARVRSMTLAREELLARAAPLLPLNMYKRLWLATLDLDRATLPGPNPNTKARRLREPEQHEDIGEIMQREHQLVQEAAHATKTYEDVLGEIRQSFPGLVDDRQVDVVTEAIGLLNPDEALVYLAHTAAGAVAILLRRNGDTAPVVEASAWCDERLTTKVLKSLIARKSNLPGEDALVGLWPAQFNPPDLEGAVNATVRALGEADTVIARLANACAEARLRRIHVIPCGLFGMLPLHAALVRVGTATQLSPLIDAVQIHFAPSLRTWVACQTTRRKNTTALPGVCAVTVGNPAPLPSGLIPLPGAELEASMLKTLVSEQAHGANVVLMREQATHARVLEAVREPKAGLTHLHFACHGIADLTRPQLSGLVLAGGEMLTVRDLLEPPSPRLTALRAVVLSACQTGLYGADLPDEVTGLPAAWLQAGAPTVVASLWPVSDDGTMALMTKFYEIHLIDGLAPGDALWLTGQWFRGVPSWRDNCRRAGALRAAEGPDNESTSNPLDAIVDWASFVVYGA
jgi:CHAT domain-containing protein